MKIQIKIYRTGAYPLFFEILCPCCNRGWWRTEFQQALKTADGHITRWH